MTVRKRSIDNIIEELRQVKVDSPTEIFGFVDDVFPLTDREWLEEFTRRYSMEIRTAFSCRIRADHINLERAKLLKEAGCKYAYIGVESGNEYIRNTVMKRNMSQECIIHASEIIRNQGMKLVTFNIIGVLLLRTRP